MQRKRMSLTGPHGQEVRLAVVAEAFVDWTLPELLDWLTEAAPQVQRSGARQRVGMRRSLTVTGASC